MFISYTVIALNYSSSGFAEINFSLKLRSLLHVFDGDRELSVYFLFLVAYATFV